MAEVDIFGDNQPEQPVVEQQQPEFTSDDDIFNDLAGIKEGDALQVTPEQQQAIDDMFAFTIGQDRFEIAGQYAPQELRQKLLEFAESANTNYGTRMDRYNQLANLREEDIYMRGRGMWLLQNMNRLEQFMNSDNFRNMLADDNQKAQVQSAYADMNEMKNEYQQILNYMQQQQINMQNQERIHRDDMLNNSMMAIERRIPNFKTKHLDGTANYLKKYADPSEKINDQDLKDQIMMNPVLAELAFKASRYDSIMQARRKPKPTQQQGGRGVSDVRDNGSDSDRYVDKNVVLERLEKLGLT